MGDEFEKPINPKFEDEGEAVGVEAVRLANAVAFPMILKSALEMGVIDVIHAAGSSGGGGGSFVSPSEIALGLPTKPTNPHAPILLDRMLRVLATHSVLRCRMVRTGEKIERFYGVGPLGRFFLKNNEDFGSLAPMFLIFHDDVFVQTWYNLKDMILEGDSAFKRAHGASLFEYAGSDQRFNKLFNQAMSDYTTMIMKKVLEVYKGFEDLTVLVDVGGGIGTNLGFISSKYPHIKGINFDLPSILADAPSFPGVDHVGGDMFADVPKGDAIYMKWILHDWNDENCLKILRNCWKALPNHGKLVVVETIHSEEPESGSAYSNIAADLDVTMLAQCSGGKERTQKEFEALAMDSGFSSCQFICSAYHCWVIEFYKGSTA